MKAFKTYLIAVLSFIFLLLIAFIVIDYFDFFKPNRFDLPNKYVRTYSPLVIAGCNSVFRVLEDLAYKNIIATSSDSNSVHEYYKNIEDIGSPFSPNTSLIKRIQADIYLTDLELKNKMEYFFEAENITDIERKYFNFSTYQNCLNSINEIGTLTKTEQSAQQIIQTIEAKILELRRKNYGKQSPKVLVLLRTQERILMGTKHSFVVSLLNALNIDVVVNDSEEALKPYSIFDFKLISDAEPDVIISLFDYDLNTTLIDNPWLQDELMLRKKINILKKKKKCRIYSFQKSSLEKFVSLKLPTVAEKLSNIVYLENK